MTENRYNLNINQIQEFLPHRAPFLLLDRVLEIHPQGDLKDLSANNKVGIRVLAQKNVSFNEPYFQGHFPGYAILPGVLVIESMAQAASFSLYPYLMRDDEKLAKNFRCILVGVDEARFRRPIIPGDILKIESVVAKCRGKLWGFDCTVSVDGQRVAEARVLANMIPNSESEELLK